MINMLRKYYLKFVTTHIALLLTLINLKKKFYTIRRTYPIDGVVHHSLFVFIFN